MFRFARFLSVGLDGIALRFVLVIDFVKPSGVAPRDDGGELKGEDPRGETARVSSGVADSAKLPMLGREFEFSVVGMVGGVVFDEAISVCSAVAARGEEFSVVGGVDS